jgi:cell division protein FtsW (lipid II flippase)
MTSSSQRYELRLIVLGLVFGWLGALSLWLQSHDSTIPAAMCLLTGGGIGAHFWLNRVAVQRDPYLVPVALALTACGFIVGARVASNFLPRQVAWMAIGIAALCVVASSRDRLRWLRRFKYTWLIAALVLLAATLLLGVNPSGAGARLWLSFAGLFLQPSEVLRLLMVAFLAAFFSERIAFGHWGTITSGQSWRVKYRGKSLADIWKTLVPLAPSVVMWLVALALLGTQQDLGAAALLLLTYAFMLYLATGQASLPIIGLLMLGLTGVIGYHLSARVALRINIWLNPWSDPQGSSFQIVQSLIAIANGGLFGQGPGQGRPDYVPAVHTDFPLAAIGEEYGLIGILAILALFAILILRAWRIAHKTSSAYALLLSGGIAALFCVQIFVIVGGNLGLLPLTGVTLPFVSYGGSSLLVSYIAVGLLIRLSCDYGVDSSHSGMPSRPAPSMLSPRDLVFQVTPAQRKAARRGTLLCAVLLGCLSLTAGYWSILQRDNLVTRSDNPRNVDAEWAIERGPILARDGTLLATSQQLTTTVDYAAPRFTRQYPILNVAPVVGYYSIQHGVGGIEAYADQRLRGQTTRLNSLLHRLQQGAAFTTTLDLTQQERLAHALQGVTGSGIVLDWRTGQVLALTSNPTFDPNQLDVNWDNLRTQASAPLLNRATQGLYQPGALLSWLYSGAKQDVTHGVPGLATWDATDHFKLGQPVPFELENSSVRYPVSATYSETLGQGSLRLTPLRVAVSAATLAAGHQVTPTLTYSSALANAGTAEPLVIAHIATLAQMSQKTHVGWYVEITQTNVTVLALEMSAPDMTVLQTAVERLQQ